MYKVTEIVSLQLSDDMLGLLYDCLDAPKTDDILTSHIFIRGWLASEHDIEILCEYKSKSQRHKLNISRKDVSEILEKNYGYMSSEYCGFDFGLEINEIENADIKVFVVIKNVKKLWKTISFKKFNLDLHEISNIISSPSYIEIPYLNEVKNISPDVVDEIVTGRLETIINMGTDAEIKSSGFCYDALLDLYAKLNTTGLGQHFVVHGLRYNAFNLPSPFIKGETVLCNKSILVGNYNYLRFTSNDEVFYVVQHKFSCDGIYFPSRKILLKFGYGAVTEENIKVFNRYFIKNIESITSYLNYDNECFFDGITISHGRPYHFYYDHINGAELLNEIDKLKKINNINYLCKSYFCSVKELYKLAATETEIDTNRSLERNLKYNAFTTFVGVDFRKMGDERLRRFESRIVDFANYNHKIEYNFADCDLVLWIGVSGQKRVWIEQVEGLAEIINYVSSRKKLGIIFDGWTSPLNPDTGDKIEIENDTMVMSDIKQLVTNDVVYESVIGSTSMEKVYAASFADAFIANSSTGSMHVSRFAKKVGVGHLNNKIPKWQHINPNITHVADNLITDILIEDKNKGIDHQDYSLDWREILKILKNIINI